ncbi:MAG: zeta toxin family protein [Bacteroidaceae bacterium]|nr:zeta toxin family protein [Bacteroidaceae bacterium]
MTKTLYIIAGPNGAGKTTASLEVLPAILDCEEFVNADEIARGLSPFHPEEVAIEAGKLQLKRIELLLSQNKTFAIETTLATRSYVSLIRRAIRQGYRITLIFLALESPEYAEVRVQERVLHGGHNIPVNVIRRRFVNGLNNFFRLYKDIVDEWLFIDNTHTPSVIIGKKQGGKEDILNKELYKKFEEYGK